MEPQYHAAGAEVASHLLAAATAGEGACDSETSSAACERVLDYEAWLELRRRPARGF